MFKGLSFLLAIALLGVGLSLVANALLSGCLSINGGLVVSDGENRDCSLRTVNGSIQVGSDAEVAGDLNTVNGSIQVGPESQIGSAETVNGKVQLGSKSQAEALGSVNGIIEVLDEARIAGAVRAVNGRVLLGPGVVVDGQVLTVNGQIRLQGATAGSLRNNRGGMVLEAGSRVLGELRVEKARSDESSEPVLVEIYADSEVKGPLVFERPVQLRVHESAILGEIQGAEPEWFGD